MPGSENSTVRRRRTKRRVIWY